MICKIAVTQPKVPVGNHFRNFLISEFKVFFLFNGFIDWCCWKWILIYLNLSWAGVDPKSILCEFFKVGQCAKGFKCKFSHDLNVQRKGEKIDIYSDKRDEGIAYSSMMIIIVCCILFWF